MGREGNKKHRFPFCRLLLSEAERLISSVGSRISPESKTSAFRYLLSARWAARAGWAAAHHFDTRSRKDALSFRSRPASRDSHLAAGSTQLSKAAGRRDSFAALYCLSWWLKSPSLALEVPIGNPIKKTLLLVTDLIRPESPNFGEVISRCNSVTTC